MCSALRMGPWRLLNPLGTYCVPGWNQPVLARSQAAPSHGCMPPSGLTPSVSSGPRESPGCSLAGSGQREPGLLGALRTSRRRPRERRRERRRGVKAEGATDSRAWARAPQCVCTCSFHALTCGSVWWSPRSLAFLLQRLVWWLARAGQQSGWKSLRLEATPLLVAWGTGRPSGQCSGHPRRQPGPGRVPVGRLSRTCSHTRAH